MFRIFVESPQGASERSELITVNRKDPFQVRVEKSPLLDEVYIVSASVVPSMGGFSLRVEYDGHGRIALENMTSANRTRRLVMFAQWTEPRWLAAPMIARPIRDGVVLFTPDATQAESERIALGINNVVKRLKK